MGSKDKLVERFKTKPKDFTYEETLSLLAYFGYHEHNKGATSGSRVRFKNEVTGNYIDITYHEEGILIIYIINFIYIIIYIEYRILLDGSLYL